ncbi:MAG: NAD kinase [Herpetosiphonaceae bacterium]|nr:MAG: NAD kinase [Herpetosiphonaceae bacterium]
MKTIGIIYNPLSQAAPDFAHRVEEWLHARGVRAWIGTSQEGRHDPAHVSECDLLLALGGDGTVLRTARLAIPYGIPILGVGLGRLSFMAEVTPDELYSGLERLIEGGGWYDERTLAQAALYRDGMLIVEDTALNEVLIARGEIARVVAVEVAVDGTPMTTYTADGVIVATATGSTAYALAAGGPILDPRAQPLVLVPVAAHLTNVPSLVLHQDARLELIVRSRHPAFLSFDGQIHYQLHEGDHIHASRSPLVCRFARVHPPSHFYETLTRRLHRE